MRTTLSGFAAIALAASCATLFSAAAAQDVVGASSAASSAASAAKYSAATKACKAAADAVVWLVPGSKLFFRKGAAKFGKGAGSYVCRRAALAKHAHDATNGSAATPAPKPPAAATDAPESSPPPSSSAEPASSPEPTASAAPTASASPTAQRR
ncbi:MAG: hypothetical protein JO083_07550 [Candidatus Eremiobacteraeota bacterium]|nr:hypothetical protein [Candidatus Eremiobacteraeota bacterium]